MIYKLKFLLLGMQINQFMIFKEQLLITL